MANALPKHVTAAFFDRLEAIHTPNCWRHRSERVFVWLLKREVWPARGEMRSRWEGDRVQLHLRECFLLEYSPGIARIKLGLSGSMLPRAVLERLAGPPTSAKPKRKIDIVDREHDGVEFSCLIEELDTPELPYWISLRATPSPDREPAPPPPLPIAPNESEPDPRTAHYLWTVEGLKKQHAREAAREAARQRYQAPRPSTSVPLV